jgi:hypothetical protein
MKRKMKVCTCGRSYIIKILFCIIAALAPLPIHAADLSIEKRMQAIMLESSSLITLIAEKQASGISSMEEVANLRSLARDLEASHIVLEEKFKLRGEKVKKLGSRAQDRHLAALTGYRKAIKGYLDLVKSLPADNRISTSRADKIKARLNTILRKKSKPIIGSLPYKHLYYAAKEPITSPTVTPAYRGGDSTVHSDDTQATPEAPISLEIAALAESLNWNPVLIYEYVKNNIETEWYFGCMKGAEDTLHQKSGNDCDQATLLVALMRASGYPTRYVRGTIEFFPDIEKAKNLTGVSDPAKLGEFFQKAGIPFHVVMDGTAIKNVQIGHIFVETMVPYSNYRGAIMDSQGLTWIALDTAIKAAGYAENQAGDILSEMSLPDMRNDYLSAVQSGTPLEYLTARINQHILQTSPTKTYTDYLGARTLKPQVMQIRACKEFCVNDLSVKV